MYPAGDGRLKTLNFMLHTPDYLETILTSGERVDGSSLFNFIAAGSSDLYVMPRFSTAFIDPFSEIPTLCMLCSFFDRDGNPLASSPEYTLRKAMDAFKKLLLRLGLTQEKLKWLTYPFSLIYAGLTGFSASVIRSLLQKLLAQHGVKGLDNFALTVLVLFIIMPNFFLTAGGVLSCAYAFILTMTSKEGDGLKAIARESLVISLGILPAPKA